MHTDKINGPRVIPLGYRAHGRRVQTKPPAINDLGMRGRRRDTTVLLATPSYHFDYG